MAVPQLMVGRVLAMLDKFRIMLLAHRHAIPVTSYNLALSVAFVLMVYSQLLMLSVIYLRLQFLVDGPTTPPAMYPVVEVF
jgi:hypothetical protein